MPRPIQFESAVAAMTAAAAAGGADYKALVCLFMFGANDAHNTVIPHGSQHTQYVADRTSALSIASAAALPLTGVSDARLHPSLGGIQSLFNAGDCAIVTNVGPLVYPMDLSDYGTLYSPGPVQRPFQLQSHSDQQLIWQTGRPDDLGEAAGWMGRINELVATPYNGSAPPAAISLFGQPRGLDGYGLPQYQLLQGEATAVGFVRAPGGGGLGRAGSQVDLSLSDWSGSGRTNRLEDAYRISAGIALDHFATFTTATGSSTMTATFPATGIGQQLRTVARAIRGRATLGQRRQLFFVGIGGFDLHSSSSTAASLSEHSALLTQVNDAVAAFQTEMAAQAVTNNVTLFTASDFGRCLLPNGAGTDHGWGGHHFVVGGAVNGGRLYSRQTKSGAIGAAFPQITLGGAWDSGEGRLLPSISVDEYGATLAKWFGVPDATANGVNPMDLVFPNLTRFSTRDLGFMAP